MATQKTKKNVKKTLAATEREYAAAIHGQHEDGVHHMVGIENLRVAIVPDGNFWFAQGLEIDYAAQGMSVKDAKRKFEEGLSATIQKHLQVYGTIEKLLIVAPSEVWKDTLFAPKAKSAKYSQISIHKVVNDEIATKLPFKELQYMEMAATA